MWLVVRNSQYLGRPLNPGCLAFTRRAPPLIQAMGKQTTKSGANSSRKLNNKREPAASGRNVALPAGDVAAVDAGEVTSHQDLIHRLKRKQEVFSKLGGLVTTLQRQENVGQWKAKLGELEELRAERDQLRRETEEKDEMLSQLEASNQELNSTVGTLHSDLKQLNDRFLQEKEVAQQLNDHISRMQADLQSGSDSKVQAAMWEQKYLDCRAEFEGSKATIYERDNTISRLRADLRSMETAFETERNQMNSTIHELKEQLWKSIEENKMRELQQQRQSFFTGGAGGGGAGWGARWGVGMGGGQGIGMGGADAVRQSGGGPPSHAQMQGQSQYAQGQYNSGGQESWQQQHSSGGSSGKGKGDGKAKKRGWKGSPLAGGGALGVSSPSALSMHDDEQ
jgi:hypothetical protein